MIEHHLDIETADGQMNTFVTHPEEGGPFPVVLFYMDAPGKREELHDMARRIATVGYFVVLPNLYYRKVREFAMERTEQGMKKMFEMTRHLSIELIMQDTQSMLDYVDHAPAANESSLGGVGYCMSGPFVLAAAGRYPERFKCGASIYGANLLTQRDDSPHLLADKIQGEMYFACAEIDQYAPREVIEKLESHLDQSGLNYRLEWYPGAEHGFAFVDREGIYHKPSAERHWERLFALFERNLRPAAHGASI
ncbi:MAG: dienelactone hydrolase family protein [Gammaproteobacteria bacterium]|nr:dienelactone hydrolase family protein [Gammaproteobacteria bacterium]